MEVQPIAFKAIQTDLNTPDRLLLEKYLSGRKKPVNTHDTEETLRGQDKSVSTIITDSKIAAKRVKKIDN